VHSAHFLSRGVKHCARCNFSRRNGTFVTFVATGVPFRKSTGEPAGDPFISPGRLIRSQRSAINARLVTAISEERSANTGNSTAGDDDSIVAIYDSRRVVGAASRLWHHVDNIRRLDSELIDAKSCSSLGADVLSHAPTTRRTKDISRGKPSLSFSLSLPFPRSSTMSYPMKRHVKLSAVRFSRAASSRIRATIFPSGIVACIARNATNVRAYLDNYPSASRGVFIDVRLASFTASQCDPIPPDSRSRAAPLSADAPVEKGRK